MSKGRKPGGVSFNVAAPPPAHSPVIVGVGAVVVFVVSFLLILAAMHVVARVVW